MPRGYISKVLAQRWQNTRSVSFCLHMTKLEQSGATESKCVCRFLKSSVTKQLNALTQRVSCWKQEMALVPMADDRWLKLRVTGL